MAKGFHKSSNVPRFDDVLRVALFEEVDKRFDALINSLSIHMVYRAKYEVTVVDESHTFAKIDTTMPVIHARIVQIYRGNEIVTGDALVEIMGGCLVIQNGKYYYKLTRGDVVSWLAW